MFGSRPSHGLATFVRAFVIHAVLILFFFFAVATETLAAPPSVISKGTNAASTSGTVTPAYPASPQADDIIFLLAISHQPVSIGIINTPVGFTEAAQGTYVNSSSVNRGRAALFWKRAAGGESGTVSVTRTGDTGTDGTFFAQMYLVRGAEINGNPWDAVTPRYGPGNATVTWDAVTVSGGERTLLAFVAQANNVAAGMPPAYTATVTADSTTVGTNAELQLFDKSDVSSDGSVTASGGAGIGWATFHIAMKRPAPDITFISPSGVGEGKEGDSIIITGVRFDATAGTVEFLNCAGGAVVTSVSSWTDTSISATVPSGIADNDDLCDVRVTRAADSQADTSLNFVVLPNVTSIAVCSGCSTNAGREYAASDMDGIIMLAGNHLGTSAGAVQFTGGFGSIAATVHGAAEGACSTSGWGVGATSVCIEIPPSISDSVYTGTLTLARTGDSKQFIWTDFRVLPRIISNTPTSGIVGTTVKISGNHFCQSGTCPLSPSRSTASDNVVFGSTQVPDSDFLNQTGGAGTCDGSGAAWTHAEICLRVPTAVPPGSNPTRVTSNSAYTSNTNAFSTLSTQPHAPANLQQFKMNGTTEINIGSPTNETSIILEADISADISITMKLQAEVKPIAAVFDGTVTGESSPVTGSSVANQRITISALTHGTSYHWRVRTINTSTLETSSWVAFGGNPSGDGSTDGIPANTDVFVDTAGPAITNPCAVSPTAASCDGSFPSDLQAQIRWDTNESATRQVAYGISCGTGADAATVFSTMASREPSTPSAVSSSPHAITLGALTPNTSYAYKIRASDAAGNVSYYPAGATCLTFSTASSQTRIMKTIEVFIQQASTLTLGDVFPVTFDAFLSESNVSRSNIFIKSAFVEVGGVSVGAGSAITITVDFQQGLSPAGVSTYTLANPGSGNPVHWTVARPATDFYWDCTGCSDVSNMLNVAVSGAQSTSLARAKLIVTYYYVP